jgi:flavin-dependent dehydrogenase
MRAGAVDVDLLVAGGGPVGLAAAVGARAAGLSVAVVEPREGPIDKACGEGLMPAAITELRRLGVAVEGWPFRGIRYLSRDRSVKASFRDGPGLGVRRTALHAALSARADAVGVLRVPAAVHEVQQDDDGVTAAGLRARWLLGADGLHSPLRRQLGLAVPPDPGRPARFGLRRHFVVRPWSHHVEVYWGESAEAYVTPVSAQLVGVAFLTGRQRSSYDDLMAGFPALAARLRGAEPATAVRGAGPLWQPVRAPSAGRILLVGDAAGYVDALTGEGVAVGLATARHAVAAVVAGRPEVYPASWRRATRRYRWSASALVAVAVRPALRRRLVPAAAALPRVFSRAIDHVC